MYPAKNGDAFLIDAAGTYILIDAGYTSTFTEHISQDLTCLSQAGSHLNLVVSTHIDADHIGGILEFIELNGLPSARSIIGIDEVWHNSLRSLSTPTGSPESSQDLSLLQAVQRRGIPKDTGPSANPISAKQGSSLARLLRERGYLWNSGDGTGCIASRSQVRDLPNGVQVQVIGPPVARLEALRDWWMREMRRLGYRGSAQASDLTDDAYEMWCVSAPQPSPAVAAPISANSVRTLDDAYAPDTSIPNGSSIALIICTGGKSMLLLGDAWADDVVAELKRLQTTAGTLTFDAIKVSHHGSLHNTSVELLSLVDAPCYLISSDASRHGHPDFEVLAEIVDRPANFERRVYFNYETPVSRRLQGHTSRSGAKFSVHTAEHDWIHIDRENK